MMRQDNIRFIPADSLDTNDQRNRRVGVYCNITGPPPERRSTISSMMIPSDFQTSRVRNLSGGSNGSTASGSSSSSSLTLDNQYTDNFSFGNLDNSQFETNSASSQSRTSSSLSHRKLDRSLSDSESDRQQRSINSSRYKTELCRPFEECGSCKYGDKCQFAHGYHELRNLSRHPKYKTELCRTFHTIGFCPYGPRCHFLHESDGSSEPSPKPRRNNNSGSNSPSLSPSSKDNDYRTFLNQTERGSLVAPGKSEDKYSTLSVNTNSNNNHDLHSLENQFNTVLNLNRNSANDNALNNTFGGVFISGNSKKEPKAIGSEENDIFKQVTMFNTEEINNATKDLSSVSYGMQSVKLDNFPSFVDTSLYWQSSGSMAPQTRPSNHSPTGSIGSDGNCSDCSGSTESLASSGCRENMGSFCRYNTGSFSPFSQCISGF